MKQLKSLFTKYFKKIQNFKYRREVRKEKSKLFIKEISENFSRKKRTSFQFFKTKLEFDNEPQNYKKIHLYYLWIWAFLIVSTVYVMVFSHYFSIKTIDIIRQDENINIELAYKSIDNFRYQPILLTDKADISRNLFSHQPNIKEVVIKKILPNNLKILIASHENMYQFAFENKTYIITKNGTLIPKKEDSKLPLLEVKWVENFWIIDYKKYFDEAIITNIGIISAELAKKTSPIKASNLTYYKKEKELHVTDENGIIVLFDLGKDILQQTQKLNVFFKEYKSKIKQNPVYIDLRINERILFCARENEYQCKLNLKSIYE